MDRRKKPIYYRPQEFKTMDPSYRNSIYQWEKSAGHLFADSERIGYHHSVFLALAIAGLYGALFYSNKKDEAEANRLLDYGLDGGKSTKKKSD